MRRFIIASGPSCHADDIRLIRHHRRPSDTVCAVNNMIFWAPWADLLYASDHAWWKVYGARVRYLKCRKIAGAPACKNYGATEIVRLGKAAGLGKDRISTGGNSGYQAINLAYLEGVTEIVLTGFDCSHTFGRRHCHEDHEKQKGLFNADTVATWQERFPSLAEGLKAEGVRVVNCTRITALDCFERQSLTDYLETT